ncbi:hypothetical protein [Methylomagnum ishizawai]|nr:hypothetical protein [Methylomagnum ishizawai]
MEAQRPDRAFSFVQVDGLGRLMVVAATAHPVDASGTIAVGGTPQALLPANPARRGAWVQNLSAGDLWLSDVGAAAAAPPALKLVPGAYYEWPYPTDGAVSVFGATTGQAYSAREW